MKAVRCSEGHWYDGDTYAACPYCKTENASKLKQPKLRSKQQINPSFEKSGHESLLNEPLYIDSKPAKKSFGFWGKSRTAEPVQQVSVKQDKNVTEHIFSAVHPAIDKSVDNTDSTKKESLASAVKRVTAMDDGKTLSFFNTLTSENDEGKTPAVPARKYGPVVGWVVAVAGVYTGESFQLYSGKNSIGRDESNKIVLNEDNSISRGSHAVIIYEPKKRVFYLQSGVSDSLVYLNDEFINDMRPINSNDIIEIGRTKLMLVPLCGTQFSWEKYIK